MYGDDDFLKKLLGDTIGEVKKEEPKPQKIEKPEAPIKIDQNYVILYEDKTHRIIQYPDKPLPVYEVLHLKLTEKAQKVYEELYNEYLDETKISPEAINDKEKVVAFLEAKLKEKNVKLSESEKNAIINKIIAKSFGYGILQPFIDDDDLEEIMVIGLNRPTYVYHRKYHMCETNVVFKDEKEIMPIIEKIAMESGRRIDQQVPLLDARLKDGSRVNATIPPISLDGPTLTIRKFKKDPLTIIDLIKFGSVSVDVAAFLWLAVDGLGARPANILVAGGTGSGKTTLLNSLSLFIPPTDRVITIEDTAELQLVVDHWVRLETRPPNIEGKGEITMDDLVKNTLRMRPDRIIVGEVRGPEARTFFTALNTGHDGGMGTLHANSARETITRLQSPPMSVPTIMIPALNFIIMQNRFHSRIKGTVRRITEIAEITGFENDRIAMSKIYTYDAKNDAIVSTGVPIKYFDTLANMAGVTRKDIQVDLETRALILEYLVAKNKRSIHEVGHYIHRFYINKDELLQEIEKEIEENPELFDKKD